MAEKQYVIFRLNNEEFGVDIDSVREIVQIQEITKLPQSSQLIEGIINLRGLIIPIVDLKKRFYDVPTEIGENSRIIIIAFDNQVVGVIADEVSEVLRLNEELIAPPPSLVKQISASCGLKGIGKYEKRLIILLDLSQAFNGDEKELLQETVN